MDISNDSLNFSKKPYLYSGKCDRAKNKTESSSSSRNRCMKQLPSFYFSCGHLILLSVYSCQVYISCRLCVVVFLTVHLLNEFRIKKCHNLNNNCVQTQLSNPQPNQTDLVWFKSWAMRLLSISFAFIITTLAYDTSTSNTPPPKAPPCDFEFRPNVLNARQGWLLITLRNPHTQEIRYGHFIACSSLTILEQKGGEEVRV